ncbi:hypothetical protein [Dactylosporangium sp. NPDC000521]|uniref:hypothetical protein n=1 Tax=Dactylosporangium sp. NPDC000521 TaxID=3363975 RepID=UPI00368950F9
MDNQFLASPRRVRNRLLIAGAALLVAFGIGAVVRLVPDGDRSRPAVAVPPSARSALPDSQEVLTGESAAAPSASPGPLRLVRGSRTTDGVSLGYPQSVAGAVSASVEWSTLVASNLDLQRAATFGTLVGDGSIPAGDWIAGVISVRELLGVATSGPVPLGASVVSSPVSYQVRDMAEDRVTVLILAFYTLRSDTYGYRSAVAVFPLLMVWNGADWKMHDRPDNAHDYAELRLQPGSSEAAAAGWLDFLQ